MPNCNFNGCFSGPYYPREVRTSSCNQGCGGNGTGVINPTPTNEWGFFTLNNPISVTSNTAIPVTLASGSGTAVSDEGSGKIEITAGTYQVLFNARGIIPAGAFISVALAQNESIITSSTTIQTETAGSEVSLSNSVMVIVNDTSTLEILNVGDTTTFNSANATITKLI